MTLLTTKLVILNWIWFLIETTKAERSSSEAEQSAKLINYSASGETIRPDTF